VVAPTIYLNCKQLGEILLLFPEDIDFMRVMVLQSLFNRIVDLENIYRIFDEILTRNERDEALHRMGILAIYDPMNVDREFRLDLRRWEHREWCKILIQLAIAEPGENWVDVSYSWSRYDSPVPGWELPEPWTRPDDEADSGPRKYGWLIVTYRSVGFGCQALVGVRKNLRKRVLIGLKRSL
jgi:Domain of unknown function (DUF4476)